MNKLQRSILVVVCLGVSLCAFCSFARAEGTTRTYYVAVDEVAWNYTPMGIDGMTGKPFDHMSMMFVEQGKNRIGQTYRKRSIASTPTRRSAP